MSRTGGVVVLGGGVNGLVAATLLAKAGRAVTLVEQRSHVGGLSASEEFHPGYRAPGLHHDASMVRPWVLAKLGLTPTRRPRPEIVLPSREGPELRVQPDGDLSGAVTDADRAAWSRFRAFSAAIRPALLRLLDRPPPSAHDGLWSLAKTGLTVRRLGADTMVELLRIMPMAIADWLRDTFATERLRAGLCLPAVEAAFTGPWSAHTAAILFLREALSCGEVQGGAAGLVGLLEPAARAAGVTVRTSSTVERLLVGNDGVTGVRLVGGEVLDTRQVLSTLDPKRTFLDLVGPPWLPLAVDHEARVYRMRGTTAVVRLALSKPLTTAAGTIVEALRTGETLDAVERAFDAAKYRRIAEVPVLDVRVPSIADPSLCPSGHAVATLLVHAVPYTLDGGWSDAARERVRDVTLAALARVCPAVAEDLVAVECLTPVDLEARYGLSGGHLHHGEHAPDQLLSLRPGITVGRYATPIAGLTLGGGSTHPGGWLTGAPGALAALSLV